MKTKVLVIAGLAVLSTSAFASKARLEALNGNNGAANLYIKDNGNVFRNAATINSHKNYIVTEWGTAGTANVPGTTPAGNDSKTEPRAEGGFFKEAGSLSYGLYLGNDGETDVALTDAGFMRQDNALDLFIGGDTGLQWGARVHYANSKEEPGTAAAVKKNSALGLGLGVVMGAAEGYANVDLTDKSTGDGVTAGAEAKLKPSFVVGGSYELSGYTFFAEVESRKTEATEPGVTTTDAFKKMEIRVGAGHVMEINPTARIIMDASIVSSKDERTTTPAATTTTRKVTSTTLPITFGFEAEAASWLTLRGSVGQNILLNSEKTEVTATTEKKATKTNTTTVNAGATLNFGKLALDGSIGAMGAGELRTDALMSRVGVTYSF